MKKLVKNALLSLVVVAVFAAPAFAKLQVVTTLASFADIASVVGGEDVNVRALTRGTQDPHFVDAKPDLVLYLNRADLVILAGLGLESGWLPPLLVGSRNGKVQPGSPGYMDVSTYIKLKEVPTAPLDRSMGDVHPGGNPHFMGDPRNGVVFARAVAEKLGEIDPAKAADYKKRADVYCARLEAKITQWSKELKPFHGVPVVAYHKSWIYFTEWAGLDEAEHMEPKPGIPPSPEHVVRVTQLMKQRHVKVIIMEPYYPKGVGEEVAHLTGAKLLVVANEVNGDVGAKSYIDLFDELVGKLKEAL